ncbi:MAG: tautomerase family protein [Alphaproteobacteria bacterium]|nr:tautomerase family protein [Alphaproteobacteria bacterium]
MPSTRIETRSGWLAGRQGELIDAVQAALVEAIRIPETDLCIRLMEYPAGSFACPPDRGPRYTIIEISLFAGRSVAAKRRLYAAIAAHLASLGVPDADIFVVLHDEGRENWGARGVALCDVDPGFAIEV